MDFAGGREWDFMGSLLTGAYGPTYTGMPAIQTKV